VATTSQNHQIERQGAAVPNLNSILITRTGDTIFVPLPKELWRPRTIACDCQFCKEDGSEGYLDTLALNQNAVGQPFSDLTLTVHHPALHFEGDRKAMARKKFPSSTEQAVTDDATPAGKRIMAEFVPQAWVNDNAVEIDGRVEFDVTEQILAMTEEQRRAVRDDQYASDNLVPSEIRERHNGPFRVEIEDAIDAYFADEANSA
jgi:hypothetical protein